MSNITIPKNLVDVQCNPKWVSAMQEEMIALVKNNTWDIVRILEWAHLVGCKWVYTIKSDGTIEHYKACLIDKDFSQKYGIDYLDTVAPVS